MSALGKTASISACSRQVRLCPNSCRDSGHTTRPLCADFVAEIVDFGCEAGARDSAVAQSSPLGSEIDRPRAEIA